MPGANLQNNPNLILLNIRITDMDEAPRNRELGVKERIPWEWGGRYFDPFDPNISNQFDIFEIPVELEHAAY